jgi:hypothetical protein
MSSLECVSPRYILLWARFQRVTILIFVPHVNVSGPHAHCTQISKQTQDVFFDPLVAHTTHVYLRVLVSQHEGHGKTSPKLLVLFKALGVRTQHMAKDCTVMEVWVLYDSLTMVNSV